MIRKPSRLSNCNYQLLEPRQLLASVAFENGEVLVVGDETADVIELVGSADFQSFTIRINNDTNLTETFAYTDVTKLTVFAKGGDDHVTNTLLRDSLIYGGDGDDTIEGGFRNDMLFGGNGADKLIGRGGDDTLRGQDGVDRMFGGIGNDRFYGGLGNDEIFGGEGADRIFGGSGNDLLAGGDGADLINGDEGIDRLFGGPDNDVLSGGDNDDTLAGQGGDDVLRGDVGDDSMFGNDGNDVLVGGPGSDRLVGNSGDDGLNGNEGDDTVYAGVGVDVVNGGRGDDVIFGGNGTNTLNGNGGNDTIYGGQGPDEIDGGSGDDLLAGGPGEDRLQGKVGADRLFGGPDNDILLGGDDDDFLAGQDGDDNLFGDNGEDQVFGNDGNDKFVSPSNNDRLHGGAGVDQIPFLFASQYDIRLDQIGSSIRLTDLRVSSEASWLGQSTLIEIEQIQPLGSDELLPIEPLLWNPIVEQITVQPVIVSDDDGSNTASAFGNAEQEAEIKRRAERVYNQAGVGIEWLPTKQWNSTFANGVGSGVRELTDFAQIISRGDAAGIGSSDPLVLDLYFVNRVPGMEAPIFGSGGLAYVGQSGAVQAIQEISLASSLLRTSVVHTMAHELGHNLGLPHDLSPTQSLMSEGDTSPRIELLKPFQIEKILASEATRPI